MIGARLVRATRDLTERCGATVILSAAKVIQTRLSWRNWSPVSSNQRLDELYVCEYKTNTLRIHILSFIRLSLYNQEMSLKCKPLHPRPVG